MLVIRLAVNAHVNQDIRERNVINALLALTVVIAKNARVTCEERYPVENATKNVTVKCLCKEKIAINALTVTSA